MADSYRDSAYFTIDTDVMKLLPANMVTLSDNDDLVPETEDVPRTDVDTASARALPSAKQQAALCRDTLKQLTDATYQCTDADQLQELNTTLQSALSHFRQHLPADAGITVNVKRTRKARGRLRGTSELQQIPIRRRWCKFTAARVPMSQYKLRLHRKKVLVSVGQCCIHCVFKKTDP